MCIFLYSGHVEVVKLLLYYGSNIAVENENGQKPSDITDKKGKLHTLMFNDKKLSGFSKRNKF